jgi:serine/threonine protein kinase
VHTQLPDPSQLPPVGTAPEVLGVALHSVPVGVQPLLDALEYLHDRGIVHRDVKPGNLLCGSTVKLLDLGSAKILADAPEALDGVEHTEGVAAPFTRAFGSPEIYAEIPVIDCQVDLWATAVTLYQAVTNQLPFGSGKSASLEARICAGVVAPASGHVPGLPSLVDEFFSRAVAPDVANRFASVAQMRSAMLATLAMPSPSVALTATPSLEPLENSASRIPVEIPRPVSHSSLRWWIAAAMIAFILTATMTITMVRVLGGTRGVQHAAEGHAVVPQQVTTATSVASSPAPAPLPVQSPTPPPEAALLPVPTPSANQRPSVVPSRRRRSEAGARRNGTTAAPAVTPTHDPPRVTPVVPSTTASGSSQDINSAF